MKQHLKGGLIFGIIALAVLYYLINPGENIFFPRCIFKSVTGYYCPGCGSQRAIHSLLHFNLAGVVNNNFLFLPAIVTIGYHYFHPHLNKWFHLHLPNIFYLKNTPWILFTIILLFWIIRNLSVYPFLLLAPQ